MLDWPASRKTRTVFGGAEGDWIGGWRRRERRRESILGAFGVVCVSEVGSGGEPQRTQRATEKW
jgi:hypothetical protein